MTELMDTAKYWVDQGISVIPIGFMSKQPDSGALIRVGSFKIEDGEVKATWTPYKSRLPTDHELNDWFGGSQRRNIAVVTGWQKLCIFDWDWLALFEVWERCYSDKVKDTFKVKSRRGVHSYMFIINPPAATIKEIPHLDILASGSYGIIGPSIHPITRRPYHNIQGKITTIDSIEDVLPEVMLKQARVYTEPGKVAPAIPAVRKPSPFDIVPDRLSDAIKQRVRILDFFPDAKPSGDGKYMAHCPFHKDDRRSLWINDVTNRCSCYTGQCIQGSEDVIGFYAKLHNINSMADAMEEMRQKYL